jgi:hypothetical protein
MCHRHINPATFRLWHSNIIRDTTGSFDPQLAPEKPKRSKIQAYQGVAISGGGRLS